MGPGDEIAPYKGLGMFEDSDLDVAFFFGRDRERDLIEANLMASRLTVLYGETGVGKSSVLRAGVAHHLRGVAKANLDARGEPELAVVVFDGWRGDPVAGLRHAVAREVTQALGGTLPPPDEGATLAETFRIWQQLLGGDLYVVLDQVEELFVYHRGEDGPGTFAVEFPAAVATPDLRVNFLLAIREDALAKLDAFKARIPNVLGNYLRLEHLDRDAARSAIAGPIARYNELVGERESVELDSDLVETVLEQVAAGKVGIGQFGRGTVAGDNGSARIETPYLQLVMQRLWQEERAVRSRVLRLDTLHRLGGAAQIVGDHVERALTALTPVEKDVAAAMFDHLVTPSGTKIAHGVGDLARYAHAQQPSVVSVLDKLGADRIVRSVADGGANGGRYEIFHDVLAEPVLAWKAAYEAQRALAHQRADADRRHRRLRRIAALATVALAVMAGITVFAFLQRADARSKAQLARARELSAYAVSQLQVDPQRSLALAVESAHERRTPEVGDVLRQALLAARERAILPSGSPVRTVSFSRDGSLVLTASDDGDARLWRWDGTLVRTLSRVGSATTAAFSPDARFVLTGGTDGVARVWETQTGAVVASISHGGPITSASFGVDGRLAVTTSQDGTARLWRPASGTVVHVVGHVGPLSTASISPDGRLLVTVGNDPDGENRRARLFALPGGRLLHELPALGVTTASFSPSGELLVTGGLDHTAAIWETASGERSSLLADHQGAVTDARFGPRGRLVATTSSDGATRIWNARTGARVALMLGHVNAVSRLSFSADGRFLVTASIDGTARVWEAETGRLLVVLRGHSDAVLDASFSPDGRLLATGGADGTARVWDPGTEPELGVVAAFRSPVRAAALSHDGGRVLEAGDDGAARLLGADGQILRVLRHPAPVTSAIFSPRGDLVLTADAKRTVRVWRTGTGALLRTSRGVSSGPLAVSADGRFVAAPTERGSIRMVETATLGLVRELTRGGPFAAAAFSPDGRLVATAGADAAARVWEARTGALVRVLEGHQDALTGVAFSRDGKRLATSSRDRDARVWEVATGKSTLLRGHFGPVFGASFSPDGRFVVTAGPTTAGLWDVSSGRLVSYLRGHEEPLTSASFAPESNRILTSSRDGTVRAYTCEICGEVDALVAVAEARLTSLARPLAPADREQYVPGRDGDSG
jgi:WD40 repeat protein